MYDGEEVFRHDVDDAEGSAGPVHGDHAGSYSDLLTKAGEFDLAGDGEVFEDLHAEGLESAQLTVGGGAEEIKCADTDGVMDGFWIGGSPWSCDPEAHDTEVAEERAFAEGFDHRCGEGDKVVCASSYRISKRAAEDGGFEEDVGVGEEKIVGGSLVGRERESVGFAKPAFGKFGDMDGLKFVGMLGGDGVDDCSGAVGGAVVDGEDVQVGVVLRKKGVESVGDVGGFVARGDDDREGWAPRW